MAKKEQEIKHGEDTMAGGEKEWTVLINGIGLQKVYASTDMDDAYKLAAERFGCDIKDILAIMPLNNPFRAEMSRQ